MPLHRPQSLFEVVEVERIRGANKRRFLIAGFLDDFSFDPDQRGRRGRIEQAPPLTVTSRRTRCSARSASTSAAAGRLARRPRGPTRRSAFFTIPCFSGRNG